MKTLRFITVLLAVSGSTWLGLDVFELHQANLALSRELGFQEISENRMLRSRSQFRLPGIEPYDLERLDRCAADVGLPVDALLALRAIENGGKGLDTGCMQIDADLRARYLPSYRQFAQAQRAIVQAMYRTIRKEDERAAFAWELARVYNPAHKDEWVHSYLEKWNALREAATPPQPDCPAGKSKPKSRSKRVK